VIRRPGGNARRIRALVELGDVEARGGPVGPVQLGGDPAADADSVGSIAG